jgi:hypothetical protein
VRDVPTALVGCFQRHVPSGSNIVGVYGLPVLAVVTTGVGIGAVIQYNCGPCRDFGGAVGSRIFDTVHGPYDPSNYLASSN